MNEPKDSPGRLCVDILVTLVLAYSGLAAAGFAAMWIAPHVLLVYTLCLWIAQAPAGLWLRRCRVGEITAAQLAAIFVMSLVFSLVIDFLLPNPAAGPHWFLVVILMSMVRLLEWLFERVPMLRSRAKEQSRRASEADGV